MCRSRSSGAWEGTRRTGFPTLGGGAFLQNRFALFLFPRSFPFAISAIPVCKICVAFYCAAIIRAGYLGPGVLARLQILLPGRATTRVRLARPAMERNTCAVSVPFSPVRDHVSYGCSTGMTASAFANRLIASGQKRPTASFVVDCWSLIA
jgi:hypothetical protein